MLKVSNDCFRCGDCIKVCPVPGVITNKMPGKVRINSYSCIECKQCLPSCKSGFITWEPNIQEEEVPNIIQTISPEAFIEIVEEVAPEVMEKAKKRVRRKKNG